MNTIVSDRDRRLARTRVPFDLIVIGGGANGCGIGWDAALRGLRVLVLEKEDFGWATSAWNSRLIHGGLKYLEKYDVRLVRESLREREWMLRAAPHLVTPLQFVLPFYARNAHSKSVLRTGLVAYDALSPDKSTPWHRVHSPEQTLDIVPGLDADGLQGSGTYYDGQVPYAERLVVETALAAATAGAVVLNHARVDDLRVEAGAVTGVQFTDTVSGTRHTVSARAVVNAAGPYVDEVLRSLGTRPPMMGGTKGTHLIVDDFPGAPVGSALYYEALTDGRPMMVIPWLGRYIIGATDVRFEGELDRASVDAEELRYILHETNRVIPTARLQPADVLWSWTGVRPLPHQASGPTGDITRRHVVHHHAKDRATPVAGLFSVIGGKLTTFRALAEHVTDDVLRHLGSSPRKRPTLTRHARLPGAQVLDLDRFAADFRGSSTLPAGTADRLLALYGTRAATVAAGAALDPALARPVDGTTGVLAAEIAVAIEQEAAVTLADIVARRIMTGLEADLGRSSLEAVASVAGELLGWSADDRERQIGAYFVSIEKLTRTSAVAEAS
ncbi:glycerol-3-phosphate dehydrogenase/oxidase [Nakamurella leprariae]|uniref:Glycerol-3-phosphate dehydrogenase/oxidase n=1 Tax=Nakamurella leprariae TaxID=2803911 RepID=A0A938YBX2_9ACTN|nr:glycerol-3-phosphate dehydrogenase/oxidase [Nakamurella leprariae]MBM9466813.1 glycerol-3-phosphate dehydrogenase/oxidase [Nakamurella leprariae]